MSKISLIKTKEYLVSVIIVNWNGAQVLKGCLKSVLELNHKNIEIIIVDNGSTDNSVNVINHICGDKANIIKLEKNIGFAAGMNIGFENAKGMFIASLNNDMIVEPSWLDQPLELMLNDSSVGIISCRQMNYYDRTKIDGLYHHITKELIFMPFVGKGQIFENDALFLEPGYVISANGGSAILKKETVKTLGGYDGNFFGYMEETDFCLRAFLHGWRCVYAPDSVVYHMDGFSFKKNIKHKYYLLIRNKIWLIYKNFPVKDILKRLPFILAIELRSFIVSVVKLRAPQVYLKARFDSFVGLKHYKKIRKENIALFEQKRVEFYRFEKHKKLDIITL